MGDAKVKCSDSLMTGARVAGLATLQSKGLHTLADMGYLAADTLLVTPYNLRYRSAQ